MKKLFFKFNSLVLIEVKKQYPLLTIPIVHLHVLCKLSLNNLLYNQSSVHSCEQHLLAVLGSPGQIPF